jgi:tetratricopeptide (TPR) repeat protein
LWGGKTYYTQVRVDPLGKESADEMLSTLLGSDESVAPLKRLIAEKTEGNPFFMEEIYQALIEEGVLAHNGTIRMTHSLNQLRIPATVQAILSARIDRLPTAQKDLLETVAIIGKDFRLRLVGKVVAAPHAELEQTLAQLQLSEFIYEQPAAGDIAYMFKHPLTHEVAYNSVLVERRKELHERVAQAIEELATNRLNDHLASLAHHYGRSGNRMKAVEYLTRAGAQIVQRSTFSDAMQLFGRAIEILRDMPAGRSRDACELALQIAIGESAFYYQGENSAEVSRALSRALELAVTREDVPRRTYALWLLGAHHQARGELRRALEVSEDLYKLAREERIFETEANGLIGYVLTMGGEFRKAERFLDTAARSASRTQKALRGEALVFKGHARWFLGFPNQALVLTREGLMSGEQADDQQYIYAGMLQWAGLTHMLCGDLGRAEELFRTSLNLSTERGFVLIRAVNTLLMGLVSAMCGQTQAGLEQLRRGMEIFGASAERLKGWDAHFAWGCELAGRPNEAFAALIPAIEAVEQSGGNGWLAHMHVLKGRLLDGKFNSAEAENSFRTSIEIARRQSAKSLELQATISLARLLARQGKRDEARTTLAEIYGWFTEGFDTADLKEAKALLEELKS